MQKALIIAAQLQALLLIVVAAICIYSILMKPAEEKREYAVLAENHVSIDEETPPQPEQDVASDEPATQDVTRALTVDFEALRQINGETAGWIYIAGTSVSYPYVQASDNTYYLSRSFYKEKSSSGTIFLDCELSAAESDVLILYGHNMGQGRTEMFSALTGYDNPEFLDAHRQIVTMTGDGMETIWTVFASLHINTVTDDTVLYRKTNFRNGEDYDEYIMLVKSLQLFETGITPQAGQRLLMLSTCIGDGRSEMRRVVLAAEISKSPLSLG